MHSRTNRYERTKSETCRSGSGASRQGGTI